MSELSRNTRVNISRIQHNHSFCGCDVITALYSTFSSISVKDIQIGTCNSADRHRKEHEHPTDGTQDARRARFNSFLKVTRKFCHDLGPYAPQGSTTLLPKLSVTSKVSARASCAWVGSRVCLRSSEDVTQLEFTSPVDSEYMRRCQKFH